VTQKHKNLRGAKTSPVIRSYLPAIVFLLLGGVVGAVFATLNGVLGPKRAMKAKQDPYECGLPSQVQKSFRFGVSFYLIAMLFILFDIEVLFLYPVAIQLRDFGTFALVETIVFIVLLFVAFVYVWRRGALNWR
jgi:NADH-quinone oxidoreductase subunit A